ncbi:hypothetical protein QL093DRAFT_2325236, partial [Fusarium oxysporum]
MFSPDLAHTVNPPRFQILGLPFFTGSWQILALERILGQLRILRRSSLVEPGQRNLPKPKPITPQQIKHFTNLTILEVDSSCFYSHVLHHNKDELIVEQETYLLTRVQIDAPIRHTMPGSNSWDDDWDNEQLARLSAETNMRREAFQEAFVASGVEMWFKT